MCIAGDSWYVYDEGGFQVQWFYRLKECRHAYKVKMHRGIYPKQEKFLNFYANSIKWYPVYWFETIEPIEDRIKNHWSIAEHHNEPLPEPSFIFGKHKES